MVALTRDVEGDLSMLFGDENDSGDDDSEGPENDEEEVVGPSTAVVEVHSLTFLAPRVLVPLSMIKDLSTRMGNQEYGHGLLVKKVMASEMVQVHSDVQIQQLQTLVAEMSSRVSTLMQYILGMDRRLADIEVEEQMVEVEVEEQMVDPVINEIAEPIVEVEEQMLALTRDIEGDLSMRFGDDNDSGDDDSEGPKDDEEVGGPSTAAAEVHSLTLLAPRVLVPPSMIKDLSTRMGNLEYGHGLLVKKVGAYVKPGQQAATQKDETIARLSQQVQTLQAAVQHMDVQIQQLQTLVVKMSSHDSTLMQYILGMDSLLDIYVGSGNRHLKIIMIGSIGLGIEDFEVEGQMVEVEEQMVEVEEQMVDPVIDEIAEPIVKVEEQMVSPTRDVNGELSMLFGDDNDSGDDDSEGPEDDEEVGGPSTAAAEVHSLTLLAPRVLVPPSMIKDLSTRMGNLEYGHGLLVKKMQVMASQMVQVAAVQHRDVQIQQVQTLVAEMSSRDSTLMQYILRMDRRLVDLEGRPLGPQ
uniref:Uncharacterized protein n=1 Tax=Tanacetum cinerariifolium TaxID=118510 RepID=A0A699HB81_TANCI|nr:hypothetical protein [Tanacetum cinerariifolium]